MIAAAQDLLNLSSSALWHGFLVFLRIGALVSLLPAFGEMSVPVRIKLGLAFAFTLIVAPIVGHSVAVQSNLDALVFVALAETANGLLLGIAVRMFIFALQTAGAIAAQSTY